VNLQTSCELCVYRIDDIGCSLGKIDIFRDRGEVTVVEKDEDRFNVIDRVCMFRRHEDREKEDVKVQLTFIILVKEKDGDLRPLANTLASIEKQCNHCRVVIVYDNEIKTSIEAVKKVCDLRLSHTNYFISVLQGDSLVPGEQIDAVFGRMRNGYYCLLESGHELRPDYYTTLYSLLYEEMNQVAAVLPKSGINEITILCVMHKLLRGGKGGPIIEKIWNTCTEQECEHMVFEWDDI
jgi:hypothetical protein